MFTHQCNTFCVVSMLFTYSIFIVSHWVSHTVLLCTITITSFLCYWYVIGLCKVKRPFWWAHLNVWEFKFSDDILSDIPPIWNCHCQEVNYWISNVWSEIPFKTVTTALHCIQLYVVIWCWATGQVSHTFITWKNSLISVNFQLLFLLCFWLHIVVVVYYTTTRSTSTTTTSMRMKRFI